MSDQDILANQFSELVFDVECYSNYFLVLFKHVESGQLVAFEMSPDSTINSEKLQWMLYHFKLIGFNSISYDLPMITAALKGWGTLELKKLSDRIVKEDLKWKALESVIGEVPKRIDHVDLIQLVPLAPGLKTLAGRMHSPKMQDLPIKPDQFLTQDEAEQIKLYCGNDLDNTILLLKNLRPQLELRVAMSKQYGIDLRSKSDAQIAEAVLSSELEKANGYRPKKPTIEPGTKICYQMPDYVRFESKILQDVLEVIRNTEFEIEESGSVGMPEVLMGKSPLVELGQDEKGWYVQESKGSEGLKIVIGKSTYQLGIGGLHSTEESQTVKAGDGWIIRDCDVNSYYPQIILNQSLYPKQCGKKFVEVYRSILDRRLEAKHKGDKVTTDTLKIVCNGSYGKYGSRYSCLYAPDLLLQVTLSGQLSLLMLIEALESVGISVISANTDGIVSHFRSDQEEMYFAVCKRWQETCKFTLEYTDYKALYSRDVNNYLAIKTDGKVKPKGIYATTGLTKNPQNTICTAAVIDYLVSDTPIVDTVKACTDPSQFITARAVTGGAHKDGEYLGKVVRWYHAIGETGCIQYVKRNKSGTQNKVPCTDGAKPLMEMTCLPEDLDYDYYVREAESILYDLGVKKRRKGLW